MAFVVGVDDLLAAAVASTKPAMAAHVVIDEGTSDADGLRARLAKLLESRFDIHHATLQIGGTACGSGCEGPEHR